MGAKPYPAYKDSGVEWIGEIPEHWEVKRLGRLGKERRDKNSALENENLLSLSFGTIKKKDIQSNDGLLPASFDAYTVVQPGDIVLRLTDLQNDKNSLRSALVRETGIITSAYVSFEPIDVLSMYLSWQLRCQDLYKVFYSLGGGLRQSATYQEVSLLLCFVPPLEEQMQIASFLDRETSKIDTLIEKQQQLINLLKEKRGSLISHTVTKGLNPNVPMKDSGVEWIGDIPEHWEVKRVKNLVRESFGSVKCGPFGSDLKNEEMTSEGIPVFNQRVVIDNNFSDFQYNISEAKFESMRPFESFPGDILITTRGTIGKVCTVPNDAPRGILHPCVMRLQIDSRRVDGAWFVAVLRDENVFKAQLLVMSNATTIEVIYQNNLVSVFVPFPPLEEQKHIAAFLDLETSKIDTLIEKANQSITLLKERRSSLISAAVTGKIDVREAA